jgi:hypothetical protein
VKTQSIETVARKLLEFNNVLSIQSTHIAQLEASEDSEQHEIREFLAQLREQESALTQNLQHQKKELESRQTCIQFSNLYNEVCVILYKILII